MTEWSDEQARERFSAAAAQFYRYGYKNGDEPINREEREQSVGRALLSLEAERDAALARVAVLEAEREGQATVYRQELGHYKAGMEKLAAAEARVAVLERECAAGGKMRAALRYNDAGALWINVDCFTSAAVEWDAALAVAATGPLPGTETT